MAEMLSDAGTRWYVMSKTQVVRVQRGEIWCVGTAGTRKELEMSKKGSCQDNIDVRSSKLRGDCSFLWLHFPCFDVIRGTNDVSLYFPGEVSGFCGALERRDVSENTPFT